MNGPESVKLVTPKDCVVASGSKRIKLASPSAWHYSREQKENESELFEQLGIKMLDTDDSNSASTIDFTAEQPVDITELAAAPITSGSEINNENGGEVNAMPTIEIFSDTAGEACAAPKNGTRVKLIGQHKNSRSPLTTVSTNNANLPMSSETHSGKTMSIAEENYLRYRKLVSHLPNDGIDHFSKLSDEMILSVFQWLPKTALVRCSEVSRRFNRVAQDETLWTRLDLGGRSLRSGAVGTILSKGVVIMRLAQAEIIDPMYDAPFFDQMKDFHSKLHYLDLSMAVISRHALHQLLSVCRHLRKLSLEHVPVNSDICKEIAANKQLEALNLTMCDGIDAHSVKLLMNELKILQSLNISWTSLEDNAVQTIAEQAPQSLVRLNIAGCRKTMTDSILRTLTARCPGLLELDVSDCTALSSKAIGAVCQLKSLEYLSLSRCYNITTPAFLTLAELDSLKFLDIFGLLNEQVLGMLQSALPMVGINKFVHSAVARPTVGSRRTSIWGLRTRD